MKTIINGLGAALCVAAIGLGGCAEQEEPASNSTAQAPSETPAAAETPAITLDAVREDRQAIADTGAIVTADLLSRETFGMYVVGDVSALHYAEAAAAYGALELAGFTGREETIEALEARYQRTLDEGIPNTENHVDANVIGVWPLELYMQNGDEGWLEAGLHLADGQWNETRPDGLTSQTRFWIDDVWMIGALQMQAYRATGEEIYLDRAAMMAAAYIERLQQDNGLFHHGPDAPFFWGRGNGWVAAGLAEIIAGLPEDHERYDVIAGGYERMMAALLNYQAEDGMWRQLIDREDSWKETSGTAMFGYAMTAGVDSGLLDKATYGPAAAKAWTALQDYIGPDGKISDVCVGTGQSQDAQYYLDRPTVTGDLHGQAPVLWFASALLRGAE